MEGPFLFEGTMGGRTVRGFGISERSLALYRDWELVDVLATSVADHAPAAGQLTTVVATLAPLVADGRRGEALSYLEGTVRPEVEALPGDAAADLRQIVDDLVTALSVSP
jgi:hypothetical protein